MMHPLETWLKARRDYIQGKGFLPDIAKKYGIPVQTVQTRAKREKWSQARAQFIAKRNEMPELEPLAAPPPPQETTKDYVSQKLTRVRLQLARLDDMLDAEGDPQRIDKLASAIARLSELERQWSDRPMPGTKRLKEINRKTYSTHSAGPELPEEPQENVCVPSFPVSDLEPEYKPPTPSPPVPVVIPAPQPVPISLAIASKAPIPTKIQPIKPKELVWGPRGVPEYR